MSSMRSSNLAPVFLAQSQTKMALSAFPTCKYPLGVGAILVRRVNDNSLACRIDKSVQVYDIVNINQKPTGVT